ncbi:P2 phage tail completion protein R (GpR) [Serratia ficaria]|uniref:phage tail protein n=1 Tax=Serratia ficaria TaxID=61651 RepID=UPI00217AD2A3|nr:phage tail protein [Serratia ficaria]CAI1108208.1 P2 phage tail completion protein R (GpR) [Serratia ficaria]CAI1811113.1 P2 phage tail completion protein R (GpR) [Serratia ficaria]CAI2489656.1 P2 phage tail completion protein R (GpR) [Serratia ficaria]CAI2511416.1 P2 phage tail completion protein R (GpR) [Serratia ficaria]CAI2791695.1 P2 phage tail completion protein R (GpR) [Serratia ficaria]
MLKPKNLRKALCDAVPVLKNNPDMLRIFIDNGTIAATLATSLSFENQYTLNLVVTDYHDDIDFLLVPIGAWLRENQPDIMTTDDGKKRGFTYIVDINSDESIDVSISLRLTERTLVREVDRELHVTHAPEPEPPVPVERPTKLYAGGELVSAWHE